MKYLQALNRGADHQTSQASKRGSGFAAFLFNKERDSKERTQHPYLSEEKYMYTISNLVSIEKCKLMSIKRLDFDTIYNQDGPLCYLEDTMLGLPSPDPLSDDSNQE